MAFVYRSCVDPNPPKKTPGPAYYSPEKQQSPSHISPVPFNQASPRNIWQTNTTPGPGAYTLSAEPAKQQIVLESGVKVFTLKSAIQTSPFKSHSKRFKQAEESGPGPGYYILDHSKPNPQKPVSQQTTLQKYLQGFHRNQEGLSTHDLGIFGDKDEEMDDQLNGSRQDRKKSQKMNVPFNSKVERDMKVRPKTSVGPGYYNIIQQSKAKEENNLPQKNRKKISQSLTKFKVRSPEPQQRLQQSEPLDCERLFRSEKSQASASAVFRRNKNQKQDDFFGSTVSRFLKTEAELTPGPGNYEIDHQTCRKVTKPKRAQISFGRYAKPSNSEAGIIISPFVCKPAEQRAPKQQQKPRICDSFGSKQPRFKQSKENRPEISYQMQQMCIGAIKKRDEIIKRKSNKHYLPNKVSASPKEISFDERPLCYGQKANTIEYKIGQKLQKNAPFSSQAARFQQPPDQAMRVVEDIIAESQKSGPKQRKSKAVSGGSPRGILSSKCPRFIYPQAKDSVCPWSYDPLKPSKKQFNKLFL